MILGWYKVYYNRVEEIVKKRLSNKIKKPGAPNLLRQAREFPTQKIYNRIPILRRSSALKCAQTKPTQAMMVRMRIQSMANTIMVASNL